MKRVSLLFFLTVAYQAAGWGQNFEKLVARISVLPSEQQQAVADSFVAATKTFPVFENDTTVVFFSKRTATAMAVAGDASNWDPKGFAMTRIGATDLWYCRKNFEADARLDYKFVIDGKDWVIDERNPLTCVGGFGGNSELRMPGYRVGPEYQFYADIPHGTLHDTTFASAALGNSRNVRIYTPPGYEASKDSLPVILFHDGLEYITLAQTNNILDYLISQKRITPVIAVFVPPVNRSEEYVFPQLQAFMQFIVRDVMAGVDASYRTRRSPAARAVLGASNGGNISLWLGFHYPHVFGNIGAQSSYIAPSLSEGFQSGKKLDLKLYLDLGTYDIPLLIRQVRSFVPMVKARGYPVFYREYHEGHSWGNWRAHLADALEYFFGAAAATTR
jgi:enterochelin esterase family protein